ncbi:hypothetical protein Tco_1359587 [Tanacetum coccineum]
MSADLMVEAANLRAFEVLYMLNGLVLFLLAINSTWSSIITEENSLKVKGLSISFLIVRIVWETDGFLGLKWHGVLQVQDVRSMLDEGLFSLKWKFHYSMNKSIPIKVSKTKEVLEGVFTFLGGKWPVGTSETNSFCFSYPEKYAIVRQ